jgi:hypothetical protein
MQETYGLPPRRGCRRFQRHRRVQRHRKTGHGRRLRLPRG